MVRRLREVVNDSRLREVVNDLAVIDLVRKFMDRPVIGERTPYAERGLGLHQGSPLSPLLCDLYLDAFDRAMLARGYRAIRYADDIAVPATDRGGAERALKDAADALYDLRLELDAAKSTTQSFIQRVARDGIDVVLFDAHGGPGARIASLAHRDPTVRRAQYRLADTERSAASLARSFVDGKIANMRVGLLRLGRGAVDPAVASVAETLAITRMVLADVSSREEMLGHEGSATREYFRGLRAVLAPEWGSTAPKRRPPPDPWSHRRIPDLAD